MTTPEDVVSASLPRRLGGGDEEFHGRVVTDVVTALSRHFVLVPRDPSDPQRERMVTFGAEALADIGLTQHFSIDAREIIARRSLLAALSPEEETE